MLIGTIDVLFYSTSVGFDFYWGSQVEQKAKLFSFISLHTLCLIRLDFDVVLKPLMLNDLYYFNTSLMCNQWN